MEIDKSRIIVGFFIISFFLLSYVFRFDIFILIIITFFITFELYLSKFISNKSDSIIFILFIILSPVIFINYEVIFYLNLLLIFLVLANIFFRNIYLKKFFLLSILIFICNFFVFFQVDRDLLYFIIFVSFFNDTIAYIFGKMIKGPLIIPSVSPNKTWSGTMISFILTAILIYQFDISILLACILSISLFIGDIFFSYIKRKVNIKDFSNFLKGHGGLLDRLDSMFFFTIIMSFIYI